MLSSKNLHHRTWVKKNFKSGGIANDRQFKPSEGEDHVGVGEEVGTGTKSRQSL